MGEGGILGQGSIQSVRYAEGKKVDVTSTATQILTSASSNVGVLVRINSMSGGATQVTFGNSTITVDSGSKPGAHILQAVDQGLTLNITGEIYAIADSGTVNLVVQPLFLRGI